MDFNNSNIHCSSRISTNRKKIKITQLHNHINKIMSTNGRKVFEQKIKMKTQRVSYTKSSIMNVYRYGQMNFEQKNRKNEFDPYGRVTLGKINW